MASGTGAGTSNPARAFVDGLVEAYGGEQIKLKPFMAGSDGSPRFVWQKVLLSFNCRRPVESQNQRRFESLQRLPCHILEEYPDILQRELLQDSRHLLLNSRTRGEGYGILHAAVLFNGPNVKGMDLLDLIMDPDTYSAREKIYYPLIPKGGEDDLDTFPFIKRALLWRHRWSSNEKYGKVVEFMRNIEKVAKSMRNKARANWKPQDIEDLKNLIRERDPMINGLTDVHKIPDPWVVVLAWATVSKRHAFILEQFKAEDPTYFDNIELTLSNHKSQFLEILRNSLSLSHREDDIVKLLVFGTLSKIDESPSAVVMSHRNPEECIMEKCFLDRLCEKTHHLGLTPLHLAAVHDEVNIVRAFIKYCKDSLERLPSTEKHTFETKLAQSLYDRRHMTPLHYAVLRNNGDLVKELTNWDICKPQINDTDIFMRSAFQMACSKLEREYIAHWLYSLGSGDHVDNKDCCSLPPLFWALRSHSKGIVKVLVEKGRSTGDMISIIREHADGEMQQYSILNLPYIKSEMGRLYKDRQVYVNAANAILVGAALIASVTFGAPWSNDHDSTAVHSFWALSSLSFFFAIATVISGATTVIPDSHSDGEIKIAVESIREWLLLTSFLLFLSVASVLGAFAAGGFSSLVGSPHSHLRTNMIVTTSIGCVVCLTNGYYFFKRLVSFRDHWLNQKLKKLQQIRTWFHYQAVQFSAWRRRRNEPARRRNEENPPPMATNEGGSDEYFERVWASLPTLDTPETQPRTGIPNPTREGLIRQHWRQFHRDQGTKTICAIHEFYPRLESRCLDRARASLEFEQIWEP
ncbi:unnamed protein product [Calypogeia fissa]